jgi:hypothetical protein
MAHWIDQLRQNPIEPLLGSHHDAISYFVRRDLLDETVPPITTIWNLPLVQKVLKKQQADGSWPHHGKKTVDYPLHHYPLVATWKQFRLLVLRYEITNKHPAGRRAAEFLFSCQTPKGDIRGMIANQYATYYTGAMLALLIRAGYSQDKRVEHGLQWLLSMRQDDEGWTVPILTKKLDKGEQYRLTSSYAPPIEPDRTKPFSHNWTNMILQSFAVHPSYRYSEEAKKAASLLKSRFFQPDVYTSYQSAKYWVRFEFWWPNLFTALDSLSHMGFSRDDTDIAMGLRWFITHQQKDGLWKTNYASTKKDRMNAQTVERRLWLTLNICRMFKRFYDE